MRTLWQRRQRLGSRRLPMLAVAVVMLLLSACSSAPTAAQRPIRGGTATVALLPHITPTYIFPLFPPADYVLSEIGGFTWLQWRPLYWFGNQGKPLFNPQLSLAYPPVFSNGGRTVTITLKPYRWSNGAPVTSRDVQFWLNLLIANKSSWAGYVPGAFPDNLVSERYMSATKFSLTFNAAYNQHWLLYNELGQITPIPQRAWDKTSSGGTVGNYDLSHSGAVAVYHFLNKE